MENEDGRTDLRTFSRRSASLDENKIERRIFVVSGRYTPDMWHKTCLDPKSVSLGNDLEPAYALTCRIRTGRSVRGFALPPAANRYERRMVERIVASALNTMCGPSLARAETYFLSQTALQGCDFRSLPNPAAVVCEYLRT